MTQKRNFLIMIILVIAASVAYTGVVVVKKKANSSKPFPQYENFDITQKQEDTTDTILRTQPTDGTIPVQMQSTNDKSDPQNLAGGHKNPSWRVYTKTSDRFSYRVAYPQEWSVEENGHATFFMPPHAKSRQESISIVVINYKETPPLPVLYTYTTIRTVQVDDEKILVRKREPSPITERYFAEMKKGDYTAEFRLSLGHQYDEVFDHMLSNFQLTTK